jgi:single-strand DNA-binding protein
MLNNVSLIGRLTKDPEIRYTPKGVCVANFTLAVGRTFDKEQTDFIQIIAFNKTAQVVGDNLKKGALIGCEGSIQTRNYEHEGRKVYVTEVIINQVHFLESKAKIENTSPPPPAYGQR